MKLNNFSNELEFGVTVSGGKMFDGINWLYKSPSGENLSVILHAGSYGRQSGLFEIMPSWDSGECQEGDVLGGLSFGEVQKWIDDLVHRACKYDLTKK